MTNPEAAEATQRPQTKSKLLIAAIAEFSSQGFDAVTMRSIESTAGVQRNLATYHYTDKAGVWKAAVDHLFSQLHDYLAARQALARNLSVSERLAYTMRSFIRFSGAHPELHRLMFQEGKQDSWRIRYLTDTFLRALTVGLKEILEENLRLEGNDFFHWYYLLTGASAMPFSLAPEAARLFGVDVRDDEIINRHADMLVNFLLNRAKQQRADAQGQKK